MHCLGKAFPLSRSIVSRVLELVSGSWIMLPYAGPWCGTVKLFFNPLAMALPIRVLNPILNNHWFAQ